MAPIRLTDRQMEIVQNVAEYVPRGLRDMTAAYLCEGFVNDRTVTAEAASAMAMKASGNLIVRTPRPDYSGGIALGYAIS
jgi:hypothetical protein